VKLKLKNNELPAASGQGIIKGFLFHFAPRGEKYNLENQQVRVEFKIILY